MNKIDLSMAVTMTSARVIGRNDIRPWKIRSENSRLKRFLLRSGVVIVGRTSLETLASEGLLKGPQVIVLTTRNHLATSASLQIATSVEEALAAVAAFWSKTACVIGGAKVYEQFLPLVNKIHLTMVHPPMPISGDAHFPKMCNRLWRRVELSAKRKWDLADEYPTTIETFERIIP